MYCNVFHGKLVVMVNDDDIDICVKLKMLLEILNVDENVRAIQYCRQ